MRALLVILMLAFLPCLAHGERYLSRAEAEALCFPSADRFEQRIHRFTPAQIKRVEKETGLRVLTTGVKVSYAWENDEVVGVVILDHVIGKHEIIDYAVAISPDGKVVNVEILEYRESYGGEVRGKKWREQFVGKTNESKLKLNSDIYNISGATMSCRHVTEGIKRDLAIFHLLTHSGLASVRRVPDQASLSR